VPSLARTVVPVPADKLRSNVQSLLNKICPENIAQIVSKVAAIEVTSCEQLETIIELIFKKALAEPHYCETYADLVFSLKSVFPEFPSPTGGKPLTFKSAVLNICQNEFEELLESAESSKQEVHNDPEEQEFLWKKRRERMRANMKFVGHLFLRQLLSVKVIGSVIRELVSCDEVSILPEEHAIECAIELCNAIGYTLEAMPVGASVLGQVCGRLLELKGSKTDQGKGAYSKRVQFQILDLLETRSARWAKKSFKTSAKTKDEIRQEQERDGAAERVIAGLRPGSLSPSAVGA
jgi:translation initiation factor 4G